MISNNVKEIVARVDRRKLTNNTQRVLHSLLTAKNEWVARSMVRVNSAPARIRDLRKAEFGGFDIECATAKQLGKRTRQKSGRQTFYRIVPSSITPNKVNQVFEGVVAATKTK